VSAAASLPPTIVARSRRPSALGVLLGLASALASVAGCGTGVPPVATTASAELSDGAGQLVGSARFTQLGKEVRVVVTVRGLPPGVHAVHVHEVGRCEPPGFASAGAHVNPERRQHGLLNPEGPHAGDLANLTVDDDGAGRLETTREQFSVNPGPTSLLDADGSALVIHAAPDDFRTDPTGNSGARIACGVIVRDAP
jgi:superoxide dismutase, Cu-Zn family